MKKAYFILFCIVCGLIQSVDMAAQRAAAVRKALQNPKYKKVLVVAHRGNWRSSAPENSLAAIDSAIQMKIDIVELDVWKTKDGKLVLMHDNLSSFLKAKRIAKKTMRIVRENIVFSLGVKAAVLILSLPDSMPCLFICFGIR